jgi:predicted nucleotidyltransferase
MSPASRFGYLSLGRWEIAMPHAPFNDGQPSPPTMLLASEPATVERLLPQIVDRLVRAIAPEKIVLFGSYAYGTPTSDSDVDLLVVLDRPGPRGERYLTVAQQLRPRLFPIDLLVRTPEEVHQALAGGDFFMREILTRGRVLYERSG